MNSGSLFAEVLKQENRHNPYPLYAQLRKTPVSRQDDGTYVVSTYAAVRSLLYDPRVSSDEQNNLRFKSGLGISTSDTPLRQPEIPPAFIFLDPPDHDRLRAIVMNQFTPQRIQAIRPPLEELVKDLLDKCRECQQIDIVDQFAYPLPVTVICKLLGVPLEDEQYFQERSTILANSLDPEQHYSQEDVCRVKQARAQLGEYMHKQLDNCRQHPGNDLLSAMIANGDLEAGRINEQEMIAISMLLLVAGHETTVNLITNGMLTLLRYPQHLDRLRQNPELAPKYVQELLRFEPPVQFRTRTTLADIEIGGTIIPQGVPLVLLFASAHRDPTQFEAPDQFNPDRHNN